MMYQSTVTICRNVGFDAYISSGFLLRIYIGWIRGTGAMSRHKKMQQIG